MGVERLKRDMLKITVRFAKREDGGLRAWSDDVPEFVLSHADTEAVLNDVEPALETILSATFGCPVMVAPLTTLDMFTLEPELQISNAAPPPVREYASRVC